MDASSGSSSRRIEFHLARKPFNRFNKDFHVETLNPSEGNAEVQKRSSSDLHLKKTEASASLDSSLDTELSFRITFRRIGAGLQNLGNTCFLNSVLQCLTYTEPLAAYLQSGKHQISCRTAGFCALCAIQRHVSCALQSTGRILAPKDLVSNLRCISRSFRNSRQEDAHEYMVNLLESMHRCCLPSGIPIESPTAYEKSLVHKIFGGRLRSQVKCMECSFCSDKFDPFLDLSLEIIKADTLHKALAHFTAKEHLDGGERQYQCQQCKQKVKALKQLKIHKTPCVLTIHLKRFGSHWSGQKIDKQVQFGPILDLKPFVTDPQDGDFKYTLYSVLVHYGWSTHSGHYYCFVRTSSGMWYGLDDNRVTQVSEKRVLEQKAYMLFYVRDRKNLVPKRPLDIIQKENMVQAMRNRTELTGVVLKESIQNGVIVKEASFPNSSAAVLSRDVSNAGVSKNILTNEASSFQDTDLMISEHPALKGKTKQESLLKEPSLKDSLHENLSASILNRGKYFPQSASLFRESDVHAKLDNADISKLNAEVSEYSQNASSKRDLCNSITLPDNCNGSKSFISKDKLSNSTIAPATYTRASAKKDVEDATLVPSNSDITRIFSGKIADEKVSAKCYSEKMPGDIGIARSKCTKSHDSEIGGSLKHPDGDGDIGNSGQHGQRKSGSELCELSSQEILNHMSLTGNSHHRKRQHKLNKKLIKCQFSNMHLSSNMLLRASLVVRKKKKHKRSKEHSIDTNLYRRFLPDSDRVSTDIVPSTSVRMDGCVQLQTNCVESTLNKRGAIVDNALGSRSDIRIGMVHEQFRERIGQRGAELSSEVQPQNNFSIASAGNKSDAKNPSSKDNKLVSRQNDLISMLTRGLEETTVARWNGIDSASSQVVGLSCMENVGIGYVADEWDEEYDRGKRKKLRSHQNKFGGPNLFQEIATKKATIKKRSLDKSSGNEPFRI